MPQRTRRFNLLATDPEHAVSSQQFLSPSVDDDFVFTFAAPLADPAPTHDEDLGFTLWWPFDFPRPDFLDGLINGSPPDDDGVFILFDRAALEAAWAAYLEKLSDGVPFDWS